MAPRDFADGLQRERTTLAWYRTGISLMAVGLLLGRFAAANPFSARSAPAVVAVGAGTWVLWVTTFRPGGLDWSDGSNRLRAKRSTAIAVIALLLHVSALVLVFVGPAYDLPFDERRGGVTDTPE